MSRRETITLSYSLKQGGRCLSWSEQNKWKELLSDVLKNLLSVEFYRKYVHLLGKAVIQWERCMYYHGIKVPDVWRRTEEKEGS